MGKADLHAHTCHDAWGDGNQTIHELFRYVEEETDLDIFAITDHDSADAARAAVEIHARENYRFAFLPGVEVTNLAGHLLCYFPSGEIADIPSLRPFWWTVEYAHARGAVCVAAHPVYPPWLPTKILRGLRQGRTLEGAESVNMSIPVGAQRRLHAIGDDLRPDIALVGNSDAHDSSAVSTAYTSFPGHTVADFLQALRDRSARPVLSHRMEMPPEAKRFTKQRSMTRPSWVRSLWREMRA
jgi:predicted metal-dependent phosphoesterase TrpH